MLGGSNLTTACLLQVQALLLPLRKFHPTLFPHKVPLDMPLSSPLHTTAPCVILGNPHRHQRPDAPHYQPSSSWTERPPLSFYLTLSGSRRVFCSRYCPIPSGQSSQQCSSAVEAPVQVRVCRGVSCACKQQHPLTFLVTCMPAHNAGWCSSIRVDQQHSHMTYLWQ